MLNSVNLQGRLAEPSELRYTQGGVPVVCFGLAVEGAGKDAPTDFFTIVCWRETAEFVARYLTKRSSRIPATRHRRRASRTCRRSLWAGRIDTNDRRTDRKATENKPKRNRAATV